MPSQNKLYRTEVERGGSKVLLAQIFYPAALLYFAGNGRSIISGNVELFDRSEFLVFNRINKVVVQNYFISSEANASE